MTPLRWGPPGSQRALTSSDHSFVLPYLKKSLRSCVSQGSALGICLSFAQHMPEDGSQLSHYCHAGGGRPSSAPDAFVPLAQLRVLAERVAYDLCQHPAGHATTCFGDSPQPLVVFAAVATAGSKTPIISQTASTRKPLYSTNATG